MVGSQWTLKGSFLGWPSGSVDGVNVNREMQIPIHGCLGVFRILSGWFVVLITENHFMGTLRDKEIFSVTQWDYTI